jgi:hypothetical protein
MIRPRWLRQLFRMQELDPYRKLAVLNPDGTRLARKPKLGWPESVEGDIKKMGVPNWCRKSQDREQWRAILEEPKIHQEQ